MESQKINPIHGLGNGKDLESARQEVWVGGMPLLSTLFSILITVFLLYIVTDFLMPAIFRTRPVFHGGLGYYRNLGNSRRRRGAFANLDEMEARDLTAMITGAIEKHM